MQIKCALNACFIFLCSWNLQFSNSFLNNCRMIIKNISIHIEVLYFCIYFCGCSSLGCISPRGSEGGVAFGNTHTHTPPHSQKLMMLPVDSYPILQ